MSWGRAREGKGLGGVPVEYIFLSVVVFIS